MKGEQNPLSSLSWIAAINKTSLSLSIVSIVIFSFNLAEGYLRVGGLFNLRVILSTNKPFNSTLVPET